MTKTKKLVHIYKNNKFKNCLYCLNYDTCIPYEECSYINPQYKDITHTETIQKMKRNLSPNPYKTLTRGVRLRGTSSDTFQPIYQYIHVINDCLRDIRAGLVGYVYTKQSLKDLLAIEPSATIQFTDGIYYIRLER